MTIIIMIINSIIISIIIIIIIVIIIWRAGAAVRVARAPRRPRGGPDFLPMSLCL